MSNQSIFIVEDEAKIAQVLVDYLKNDGFEATVLDSGGAAVEKIKEQSPDLVILDLMLPEKDGMTICREVRQFSNVPIIMLTARVKTVLRRVSSDSKASEQFGSQIVYRSMTLQADKYLCLVRDERVDLTPVEFRLLQTMVAKPGRVFSRDNLMEASYPDGRVVSDRTVDSHVKNLRKKVMSIAGAEDLIHSVYGVGYKVE